MATTKNSIGRRTILTKKMQASLIKVIEAGNYYATACKHVGISVSVFHLWLKKGEDELERIIELADKTGKEQKPDKNKLIYVEFMEAVRKADSRGEMKAVESIHKHMDGDWKAAIAYLERRHGEWGRKDKHEVTGKDGAPLQVVAYIPANGRPDDV